MRSMIECLFTIRNDRVLDPMRDFLRRGWAYAVPAGPGCEKIFFCVDGVRS